MTEKTGTKKNGTHTKTRRRPFFLSYLFGLDLSLVSVPAKQVHGFALVYILATHESVCFVLLYPVMRQDLPHTKSGKSHPYRSGCASW